MMNFEDEGMCRYVDKLQHLVQTIGDQINVNRDIGMALSDVTTKSCFKFGSQIMFQNSKIPLTNPKFQLNGQVCIASVDPRSVRATISISVIRFSNMLKVFQLHHHHMLYKMRRRSVGGNILRRWNIANDKFSKKNLKKFRYRRSLLSATRSKQTFARSCETMCR